MQTSSVTRVTNISFCSIFMHCRIQKLHVKQFTYNCTVEFRHYTSKQFSYNCTVEFRHYTSKQFTGTYNCTVEFSNYTSKQFTYNCTVEFRHYTSKQFSYNCTVEFSNYTYRQQHASSALFIYLQYNTCVNLHVIYIKCTGLKKWGKYCQICILSSCFLKVHVTSYLRFNSFLC